MQIYYGITDNSIEVTEICLSELVTNNVINIPRGDFNRARFFSDPLPGIFKQVIILQNGIFTEYDAFIQIKIDLINNTVTTLHDNDVNEKSAAAPLWQQAFQFLIDKYGLRGATEKEKRLENLKVLIKFAKDISCHITNS